MQSTRRPPPRGLGGGFGRVRSLPAMPPTTPQNPPCVMRAARIATRDAMASRIAMVMAAARALGMTSEYAMQGERPAGFVAAALIPASPGSRYHDPIPRLTAYRSPLTRGALTANTTCPSRAGPPSRNA